MSEEDGKEGAKRLEIAVKQGVDDRRKEGGRRKEEGSGSLERKREEEELRMESGVIGWDLWRGIRQGERRKCMERFKGLEGKREGVRSIKERNGEVRERSREVNEEKGKERIRGSGVVREWQW